MSSILNYPTILLGGLAQLVERLLCKQNVIGSNPCTSTIFSHVGREVMQWSAKPHSPERYWNVRPYFWEIDVTVACLIYIQDAGVRFPHLLPLGQVAKLADALDLGSSEKS